jgi:hypothetical protein
MSAPSSERMRSAAVHESNNNHVAGVVATLNGRAVRASDLGSPTEQRRAKHIGLRPAALPPSTGMRPPEDRDSTRVFVMGEGRAGIVFARGIDGKRPPQKLVASLAHAEALVRDYKLAKPFIACVAWLANMLPREAAPVGAGPIVSKSGVRSRLSETLKAVRRSFR